MDAKDRMTRPGSGLGQAAARVMGMVATMVFLAGCAQAPGAVSYPWHTDIVATSFWVGEIHDPHASDGSQEISTYDSRWMENYGGCDGLVVDGHCTTEARTAENDYFPSAMTPRQNPFYLDLPYDDVNNDEAFARRCDVIPWAYEPGYAGRCGDRNFSLMKNRWVEIVGPQGAVCYGQVQDAGPAVYDDARYVFGTRNERPASTLYHGAGMDVSPALTSCLGFSALDGTGYVSWRFVSGHEVPAGPWTKIVTTSQVG